MTECPVPPGASKTYKFRAQQYGTSWYHSHFSAQYANGVFGTIVINGPSSLNYDIDLGAFPITDYYYRTADDLVEFNKFNGPPPSDNVLFNGTNKHPVTGVGAYANVTLTPGKRHKLRIINTSAENHFVLTLDKHDMTVIAMDFVPVNSFTTKSLFELHQNGRQIAGLYPAAQLDWLVGQDSRLFRKTPGKKLHLSGNVVLH